METTADEETLTFVSGKSDVKMVSYGGMGHPAVYSNAPPDTDSDLKVGISVENTADAWDHGLETIHQELWRQLDRDQEQAMTLRNMDRLASEMWGTAIDLARLLRQITGKDIKFAKGKADFYLWALRQVVLSQDHAFRRRLRENMSPLLMRTLRKFVMKC